jgi:processive 1,2-diacylglycerol beta-glucosyltransferase
METTVEPLSSNPRHDLDLRQVLILSASAGAGHVRAAQALEQTFAETGTARAVQHRDALAYVLPPVRRMYGEGYLELVTHAPAVLGWLYDALDAPGRHARLRAALDGVTAWPLARLLETTAADWIVCTHFLPAAVAAALKARGRLRARLAVVVTDFDVHGLWVVPHVDRAGLGHRGRHRHARPDLEVGRGDPQSASFRLEEHVGQDRQGLSRLDDVLDELQGAEEGLAGDRYFVALEETRRHLARLGVPAARITVSGIPIDPVFADSRHALAMARKHGLDPMRWRILVTAGGFGVDPVERLVGPLLDLRHSAQVVVICGRSAELKRRLEALAAARPADAPVTVRPIGYTRAMDEYMAAADLLVGKPGGLTTAEALARGLPMVIVHPIPGQEERNADHLLEAGARDPRQQSPRAGLEGRRAAGRHGAPGGHACSGAPAGSAGGGSGHRHGAAVTESQTDRALADARTSGEHGRRQRATPANRRRRTAPTRPVRRSEGSDRPPRAMRRAGPRTTAHGGRQAVWCGQRTRAEGAAVA